MGFLGIRVSGAFSTNFFSGHIVPGRSVKRLFSPISVLGAFFISLIRNNFFRFRCFNFRCFSFLCFCLLFIRYSLLFIRYSLLFFYSPLFRLHCVPVFLHCRRLFCDRLILQRGLFSASCFFLNGLYLRLPIR